MMRSPRPPTLDQTSWRLAIAALSVVLVGVVVVVIGVMATPSAQKPTPTPAVAAAMAFQEGSNITPTPRVIAVPGTTPPAAPPATATTSPAPTATSLPTEPVTQDVAPVASTTPTPWLMVEDATPSAATTPAATIVSATTPPATIAAVIVPTATTTVLPVAVLPSPTPVLVAPTPVPPAPTVVPLPTPTVAPTPATVLPTIAPPSTARLTYTAADWNGGFYRGDAQYYGRPWVAIYGAYSEYPRATLSFTLTDAPSQAATLTITGLDDEWPDLNQVALDVNGQVIFTGESPFPNWDGAGNGQNAAWTSVSFSIPTGVLRAGSNDITLSNLTPADSFNSPPYVLVSDATLELPGANGATVAPVQAPAGTGKDKNDRGPDKHQEQTKAKDDKSNSNGNGKKKGHDKNKHGR